MEIQALQATIEKMKLDHEALRKKSKMNDNRLQQLIRDQNDIISGVICLTVLLSPVFTGLFVLRVGEKGGHSSAREGSI